MKKSYAPLVFGLLAILVGLAYLGGVFFGWSVNLFFDGWWTLFIIVPCFVSMLSNGINSGNMIGLLIGALLLLRAQGFLSSRHVGIFIVAVIIIGIGISLIAAYFRKPRSNESGCYTYQSNGAQYTQYTQADPPQQPQYTQADPPQQPQYAQAEQSQSQSQSQSQYTAPPSSQGHAFTDQNPTPNYNAILSSIHSRNTASPFLGGRISAILGAAEIDLREAVITSDVTVYVSAVMGGVDVLAPKNVRIAINKSDILGGTDCKAYTLPPDSNAPICSFVCTTVMAGIDIK